MKREKGLKGRVEITVIDRKTGAVKKKSVNNDIILDWADFITGVVANGFSGTLGKYDSIEVKSGTTSIKTLTASVSKSCTQTECSVEFTATDSSTDEYTANILMLKSSNPQDAPTYLAWTSVSINKTADDIVKIKWTVTQSASSPTYA